MKGFGRNGILASLLMCSIFAHAKPQERVAVQGDATAGKFKSEDQRCQECHGSDGNGEQPERKYAKLAGQSPAYLIKQMQDYRSNARRHDFMTMAAGNLDERDIADISAYYASLPKMHGEGASDAVGKDLFTKGDTNRNILPCGSCHGLADAAGMQAPVIAGQERNYLEQQLQAWRSGERSNSAGGVMNVIGQSLNDAEIHGLAEYISGLKQ